MSAPPTPISTIEFTSIMVTNKGNRTKVTTVPAVGSHLSAGVVAATTVSPVAAVASAAAAAPATGFDPSWITFLRYCNVTKKK